MTPRIRQGLAATGIVGVALLLVALFLPGAPARTSDPPAHLATVLIDERAEFLVGTFLAGLGALALLFFLGALRDFLGPRAGSLATTATAGGIVFVVLMLVGIATVTGLALGAARLGDDAVVRALTDVGNVLIELSKFGLAALVLATVAAGRLARGTRVAGVIASGLLVLGALPPLLAQDGFWQLGGLGDIAGDVPVGVWLIWLSRTMIRRAGD